MEVKLRQRVNSSQGDNKQNKYKRSECKMLPNNINLQGLNMDSSKILTTQQLSKQLKPQFFPNNSVEKNPTLFPNINNLHLGYSVPKVDAKAAAGEKPPSIFSQFAVNDQSDEDWGDDGSANIKPNNKNPFQWHGNMVPKKIYHEQNIFNDIQQVSIPWQQSGSSNWGHGQSKVGNEVYYANAAGKLVKKPAPFIPGTIKLNSPKNCSNSLFNPLKQTGHYVSKINPDHQQSIHSQYKDSDSSSMNEYKHVFNDDDYSGVSQQSSNWSTGSKKQSIFQDKKYDTLLTNAVVPKIEFNNVFTNQSNYKDLFKGLKGDDKIAKTNAFQNQDVKPAQILFGPKKENSKQSDTKDLIDLEQKPIQTTAYQIFSSQTKKQQQKTIFSNQSSQTVKIEKTTINNTEQCEALKQRVKQLELLNKQYLSVIESLSEAVKNLSIVQKTSPMIKGQQTIFTKKIPDNEKTIPKVLKKNNLFDDSEDD